MANTSTRNLKRFYWVFVAVALLVVAYQLSSGNGFNSEMRLQEPLALPGAPELVSPEARSAAETALASAESVLAKNKQRVAVASQSVKSGVIEAASAWQTGGSNPTSIPLPNGVVVYEPVSVDMESPAYPMPGEQVSLPLPGGEKLVVNVESSNENPNGDYSWRGHLDGQGTDYPVVMTYGANSVFATVTTPKGSYTLESVNGSGWIYKNPSEFELSEPGKNDYLEIPHVHEHE